MTANSRSDCKHTLELDNHLSNFGPNIKDGFVICYDLSKPYLYPPP